MSLLDRVREANRHDFAGFIPWRVAGQQVGAVRTAFAQRLARWPEVFRVQDHQLTLAAELDGPRVPFQRRSEAVAQVCRELHRSGELPGWREESYPVARAWGAPPLLLLERAAVPFFGVTAYGVHMNGFVGDPRHAPRVWVARRSLTKPTGPGKLDQLVAGGQPHGIGLRENMIKECAEEAGIPRGLAEAVRPTGTISYVLETDAGLRPDVIFNFDLQLPPDFEPVNTDGEVEEFFLWDLDQVADTVAGGTQFKFNCALVVIDFLIRHGHVAADHPDLEALLAGLHADPRRVPESWSR